MIGDTAAEGGRLSTCEAGLRINERREMRPVEAGQAISVLFVDDRDSDAVRIKSALAACRDLEVELDHVSCPREATRQWETGIHDLALFDIWLGNGTSMGLLAALAEDAAARPVVVLSNLPAAEVRILGSGVGDLMIHSKENLSSSALALTLSSALALSRRIAVGLHA